MYPQLGAAGSTYARTCIAKKTNLGALPDPGLIFDSIFARTEYTKHPNNVSSVLWYWATIIIHGEFIEVIKFNESIDYRLDYRSPLGRYVTLTDNFVE